MKSKEVKQQNRNGRPVVPLGIEISDEAYRVLEELCKSRLWTKRVVIEQAILALSRDDRS